MNYSAKLTGWPNERWPDDPHWFDRVMGSLRCPQCERDWGQPSTAVGRLVCPDCEHEWDVDLHEPSGELPKVGDWVRVTDTEHSCFGRVMRVVGSDPRRIGQLIELDDGDDLVVRLMPGLYEPTRGP